MRVLILSSRCTDEQRKRLASIREILESHGDFCEELDWLAFLADSVSQISTHSRKLVRHHLQDLFSGDASNSGFAAAASAEKGGIRRLIDLSAEELSRVFQGGDYDIVFCAEPAAHTLLTDGQTVTGLSKNQETNETRKEYYLCQEEMEQARWEWVL